MISQINPFMRQDDLRKGFPMVGYFLTSARKFLPEAISSELIFSLFILTFFFMGIFQPFVFFKIDSFILSRTRYNFTLA